MKKRKPKQVDDAALPQNGLDQELAGSIPPPLSWPTREALETVLDLGRLIVAVIRRYWSVDGRPLSEPKHLAFGDFETMHRAAVMLRAVREQRRGNHPGAVLEWQLWGLASEWVCLDPGRLAFEPNWYNYRWWLNPPKHLVETAALPPVWNDWPPHVPAAYREVILAAHPVIKAIVGPQLPETFVGAELDAMEDALSRLRNAIAFVPTDLQRLILETLAGRGLSAEKLMAELSIGSKETLYGKRGRGGLAELVRLGLVSNKRGVGYYRPDAPPAR